MKLSSLDRAFLGDVASVNWLHHFVVSACLVRAGAESLQDGTPHIANTIVERYNLPQNLAFMGREPIEVTQALLIEVQSLAMLRIFQERIAAMEMLGALLVALTRRESLGVAQAHYEHTPAQIGRLYREILDGEWTAFWTHLGWPSLELVGNEPNTELAARFGRLYPRLAEWLPQVARAYLRPQGLALGTLGHVTDGYDPRASVFVVLKHEERWRDGDENNPDWIIKAYNMVKHGFNATISFKSYEQAAKEGKTAIVLEIPRTNEVVQRFGQETDLTCTLCREIARMTLDLDEANALTASSISVHHHTGNADMK